MPYDHLKTEDLQSCETEKKDSSNTDPWWRVTKGAGALSLGAVIQVIGQLSLVPVALSAWGEVRYGEWVMLTGLVLLLKLVDLGMQPFVVNRLCASYARGDKDEMLRVLHSALRVQLPLVVVIIGFIIATLFLIPVDQRLGLATVNRGQFFLIASLLSTEILLSVPMGVVAGLYRATGRLARSAMIAFWQQVIILGVTLTLIACNFGFPVVAGARMVLPLVIFIWILRDLWLLYPWFKIWPRYGSFYEGLGMIGPGVFFLLIPLADYVSNQCTLLVIQTELDGAEVARFATHRTVVNIAQMASGILMNAVWPEFTATHARGEPEHLRRLHRLTTKLNVWIIGVVAFSLLPLMPWLYSAWTAGRLSLDEWTLTFLFTRMLIWGLWSPSMTVLQSINRHQTLAIALFGGSVVTGVLSLFLVPLMGISGAALASLLGDLCVPCWLAPLALSREIGGSLRQFGFDSAAAAISVIGLPVTIAVCAWISFPSHFLKYVIVFPLCASIAALLMWRQLLSGEREIVISLYDTASSKIPWLWRVQSWARS